MKVGTMYAFIHGVVVDYLADDGRNRRILRNPK